LYGGAPRATEPFFRAWYVQYPRYFYMIFQPRFFFFTPSYPQNVNVNLKPVGSCTVCLPWTSNKERKEEKKTGWQTFHGPAPNRTGNICLNSRALFDELQPRTSATEPSSHRLYVDYTPYFF
jgi:hypothetical protein